MSFEQRFGSALGGWESAETVRRYAHLSADHLVPYADRLCALSVVDEKPADGTFTAQLEKEKGCEPATL